MNGLEAGPLAAVLAWGVVVALDLVSGPQMLLSRPVVAGTVAGLLLGDPVAGMTLGALMELYALEVVPIGATRYPDFGVSTVVAVVAVAGRPLPLVLGLAAALALLMAQLSRPLMDLVRRRNAGVVQRHAEALAAGDPALVTRLQLGGLGADAARGAVLAAAGIAAALLLRRAGEPPASLAAALAAVAVAGGAAAALSGLVRTIGQGGRLPWLVAGGAGGLLLLGLR